MSDSSHPTSTFRTCAPDCHALFEASGDAIFLLDGVRFVACNPSTLTLFGCTERDILGKTPWDFSPPRQADGGDSEATARANIKRAYDGAAQLFEWRHQRPDGGIFEAEIRLNLIKRSDGPLLQAIVRDITVRKQALAALHESRDYAEQLLSVSGAMLLVLDRQGRVTRINPAGCAILRGTEADLLGQDWIERFIPERVRADLHALFQRVLAGDVDSSLAYDNPLLTCAGEERHLTWHNTPLHDAEGRVTGVLSSGLDISEQRRAETALVESEARIRAILDTAVDGILVVDEASRVVFANPAISRLTGYGDKELQDRPLTDLMPERYRSQHEAGFNRYLSCGQPSMPWRELAFMLRHRDGHEIPVEVSIGERGGAGQRQFIGILRDVSERRRGEERLRQSAKVFESTTDGVTITDVAGNMIAVNRAFTVITGYTEAEVLGRNPRMLKSGRQDQPFYQAIWNSIAQTGSWSGEIWNRRKNGEIYPEWLTISGVTDAAGKLTNYVGVFSDISQIKQSEAERDRLAHFDPLTELPNRLLFNARLDHALQRAERDGTLLTLLFIDLDRFKNINDALGHPAGDRVLQDVARRLSNCGRAEDTVSRLGGDEFAMALEGQGSAALASGMADKLLAALTLPFDLDGQAVFVGASIGISIYPTDGKDAATLLKNADAAMHQSKDDGRNTFRFYNAAMTRAARERLTLETNLRHAIERQEFLVYYQPQVDVSSGAILGVEALVRWDHPASGLIAPDRFIPLAEETGLIVPLGEWVLFTACTQARAWLDGADLPNLSVAVNLSPRQFRQHNLAAHVRAVLDASGLPAALLELEITESAIMENPGQAIATLQALKDLGITISIDDFGTGYSSLAHLKRFPIDKLKIDQSFIRDIPQDRSDMEIAATIIAMARNLHLKVLAEGVETEDQLAFLQIHGCDAYQGYLCSRPIPAPALEQWLAQRGTQA
ncbi:MAG: EAL domain-containing protein [Pseudomonadota bacterium]|nr:EAL domain-containing protein [Pseudomonadota bacterium]